MSDDGAHLGVDAERALSAIMGDKQPTEEEMETVEEMRERILAAPIKADYSYDGSATACARIILEAFEEYPELLTVPTEMEYLRNKQGKMVLKNGAAIPIVADLYGVLMRLHREGTPEYAVFEKLTGSMWDWAVNAARRCVHAGPVANPAIVTLSDSESSEAAE